MTIDIRATVTCSLGAPVIGGSVSDDYVQGVGLIKTRGSLEVSGLLRPATGTVVSISYTKNGITRQIPRQLRVLSFFADPFRRTTKIELGCQLTYSQNKRKARKWTYVDDPENADVSIVEAEVITRPIYASSVLSECLVAIGAGGGIGLTNQFSVPEFDFSSGYFNIASDLLVSECLCGYLNQSGVLNVMSLNAGSGSSSVITANDLIDVGAIGVGERPGAAVAVTYSTIKLKEPDPQDTDLPTAADPPAEPAPATPAPAEAAPPPDSISTGNVEREEMFSSAIVILVGSKEFRYTARTVTESYYDDWDRKVFSRSYTTTIGAALNSGYVQELLEADQVDAAVGFGSKPAALWKVTNIKYRIPATRKVPRLKPEQDMGTVENTEALPEDPSDGDWVKVASQCFSLLQFNSAESQWEPVSYAEIAIEEQEVELPDGYDEITSETTREYKPEAGLVGAIASAYINPETQEIFTPSFDSREASRTEVKYTTEYSRVFSNGQVYQAPTTTVRTQNYVSYGETQRGQQDIALRQQQGEWLSDYVDAALQIVWSSADVRIVTGREAFLQRRPSKSDEVLNALAQKEPEEAARLKAGDAAPPPPGSSKSGYGQESVSETAYVSGSSASTDVTTFSMPYAPDDVFFRTGTCPDVTYGVSESDADAKARAFGRAQNRLLLGNRHGMQMQMAPEKMPAAPMSNLVLQSNGVMALYKTNGTSWAFDANGVIASTDALFWGAIGGGTGSSGWWFPVAPGVTQLPAAPTVVDGVVTHGEPVPPWSEIVKLEGRTRSMIEVTSLPYPLGLLTQAPVATRTTLQSVRVSGFAVPFGGDATITALAPRFEASVDARPVSAGSTIAAGVPVVGREVGIYASPAAATIAITAYAPNVPGASWHMRPPAANITVAALAPTAP
jgi:hypothetical protein